MGASVFIVNAEAELLHPFIGLAHLNGPLWQPLFWNGRLPSEHSV